MGKSRSVPNQIPNGFHGGCATCGYAYAAYAPASYSVNRNRNKNRNRNRNKTKVRSGGPVPNSLGSSYVTYYASNSYNDYDSYDYDSQALFINTVSTSTQKPPIDQVIDLISLQNTQGYFTKSNRIFET